jgi:hypothetical protein
MTTLLVAFVLMIAVVGAAGRWASVKNRRLQAEWSETAVTTQGLEGNARDHR